MSVKTKTNTTGLSFYWWVLKLFLKPGKRYVAWQLFDAVVSGLIPVAQAYVIAKFLAEVARLITTQNASQKTAVIWLAISAGIIVVERLVYSLGRIIQAKYDNELEILLESQMFTIMYSLSQQQFDDEKFNTQLSKASQGMFSANRFLSIATTLISAIVRFVGSITVIVITVPIVGVVIVLTLIPLLMVELKINRARQDDMEATDKNWQIMSRTRWLLSDPTRMPEIRLLGSYKKLIDVWIKHKKIVFRRENRTNNKSLKYTSATEVVSVSGEVFANLWFLRLAVNGALSLDRFLFLRGLLQETTSSGTMIVTSIQSIHESALHLANLKAIVETKPAIPGGTVMLSSSDPLSISFKNVSFCYPGANHNALNNISFTIGAHDKLALVGENGAGKSTIIKLLLRQYVPVEGEILVNNIPLNDLAIDSFYRRVSTLFQDFALVEHLSIKDNISFGSGREMNDQEIQDVAQLTGADLFIKKLKHGYDERLMNMYDDGSQLSGGQTQRLGIARTLARKSDLLVLDEPTSAIDAKAEYTIFNNIYESHEDRATLIISHRFSTVRQANHILVLEDGAIIEEGSHESLLKQGGLYKDLFEKQAEGYR